MDINNKNRSLLNDIYLNIKENILKGKYKPGERLVLSKLSKEFGVSHTPINEALNRLVIEDYVEYLPRRGMKVKEISLSSIAETYDIRKMFEMYVADKMIIKANNNSDFLLEIKEYSRALEDGGYNEAYQNNFVDFFEYETKFHTRLVSACDNLKLINMYNSLKANSIFYHEIVCGNLLLSEIRFEETVNEHKRIIDAISNSDLKELNRSISDHIDHSVNFIFSSCTKAL